MLGRNLPCREKHEHRPWCRVSQGRGLIYSMRHDDVIADHDRLDLSPYDGILLISFGGPEAPDEVVPFLQNATRGSGIPVERLKDDGGGR